MIIQGSNLPIVFTFANTMTDIQDIEISLRNDTKEFKHWTLADVTIDNKVITAPITQDESTQFPAGKCFIEVKWLDSDGETGFANPIPTNVVERKDKTIMTTSSTTGG